MDCAGIRERQHEYLRGWLEADEASAVERHTAGCDACQAEAKTTRSALTLLDTLPELTPDPETWTRLEAKISPKNPKVFRFWLRTAAAASILVAALSFAVVLMPRTRALPVVVENGKALKWNERYTTTGFATLTLPDIGTLRVDQDSTLRFLDARTVLLESGRVFADIIPSGKGFEVRTSETTVKVHGTRFGVTAPSAVYVVEGRVEVRSGGSALTLGAGQAASGPRMVEVTGDDALQWLARHERPAVRLTLDPQDRTTITPGAPLKWTLTLSSDALVPLRLGQPRDLSQFFSLTIDGNVVALDPSLLSLRQGTAGAGGLLRLDGAHPVVFECAVDPALFRQKGRSTVRAFFTSGTNAPERAWTGVAKSEAVAVDVR
jgi:ferric-dicitrate binding protein FerR (iron transport regulator)